MQNPDQLQVLAEILRKGSEGKASYEDYEKQIGRAQDMQDADVLQDKRTGYVSPFSALANVVGASQGRRKERMIRPELAKAKAAMSNAGTEEKLYTLQRAMEQEKRRQFEQDRTFDQTVMNQNRTYALQQQKFDAEQAYREGEAERELQKLKDKGEAIQLVDKDGNVALGREDGQGNIWIGDEMADARTWSIKPKTSSSASQYGYRDSEDEYGNKITLITDKNGGQVLSRTFANGQPYSKELAVELAKTTAEQVGAETAAKEQAKSDAKRQTELATKAKDDAGKLAYIDQAIYSLRGGAQTGPIANMFRSFAGPTVTLENAVKNMALRDIGNYTMGSLSDAEGQWLTDASAPLSLEEEPLEQYFLHRREATLRVMEANAYEQEALANGEKVDPALIRDILTHGGFDISENGWKK